MTLKLAIEYLLLDAKIPPDKLANYVQNPVDKQDEFAAKILDQSGMVLYSALRNPPENQEPIVALVKIIQLGGILAVDDIVPMSVVAKEGMLLDSEHCLDRDSSECEEGPGDTSP